MIAKLLEIRDRATFLPVLCVDMNSIDAGASLLQCTARRYLLRRLGFPDDNTPNIMMTSLALDGHATNDPYDWRDRTRQTAHHYITENWATLNDGDVVDVEFILGETSKPKLSEKHTT